MTAALSTSHRTSETSGTDAPAGVGRAGGAEKIRLPLGRVAAVQLGSWAAGSTAVLLGAWLTGLLDLAAGALAAGSALLGVLAALAILACLGAKTAFTWATVQVGTSAVRLCVGLGGALMCYLMLRSGSIPAEPFGGVVPGKAPFFGAFLLPAVLTLIADAAVFRAVLTPAVPVSTTTTTDDLAGSARADGAEESQ